MKDASKNGSDERLKTQYKLLGKILYSQSPSSCQRSLVGQDIQKKNLFLSSSVDPVATVLSIVKLVPADPPNANVIRLLNQFQNVVNCPRSELESLLHFAIRFRAKASKLLLHAQNSSQSKVGQVVAITLLNITHLDKGTLKNAKSNLFIFAKNRKAQLEAQKTERTIPFSIFIPAIGASAQLGEL